MNLEMLQEVEQPDVIEPKDIPEGRAAMNNYADTSKFPFPAYDWCGECRKRVPREHFISFPEHFVNWVPSKEQMKADPMTVRCPSCGERVGSACIQMRWGAQKFCLRRFAAAKQEE